MEHGTTEEECLLHQVARMNEKLKRAFLKKFQVSEIARTQLFQIPQCCRQQYRPETNGRLLDMVDSAVKNWQGQSDKLYKTVGRITTYYKQVRTQITYEKSTRAQDYISCKYEQPKLNKFYNKLPRMGATEQEGRVPYISPKLSLYTGNSKICV